MTSDAARLHTTRSKASSFLDGLFAPIDGSSIAVFRILFGLIIVWEVARYFAYGWIPAFYIEPDFHFSYPGFEWLGPWPGNGMYWHFAGLGVLGAMIATGLFYRAAMALFFVGFTYVFLLDQARYLNHFYLVVLVAFLMIFVPASRNWSLDAFRKGWEQPQAIPRWTLAILCLQLEIMLIHAGLVKIDREWLAGEPIGIWLSDSAALPVIGPWLLDPTVVLLAAYGSVALHIVGAPLLLFKATRLPIFLVYCVFHVFNAVFWDIGIFPWFTIAGTMLFFAPSWPRDLLTRLKLRAADASPVRWAGSMATVAGGTRLAVAAFVVGWGLFQAGVPLRYLLYPGYVSWHEQGHQFSWQMMLRSKEGVTLFAVRDPATGREWQVEPRDYLTERQERYMSGRPELMRRFAHHVEGVWAEEFQTADVEVRVYSSVSLNGRPSVPLVDPARDLTAIGYSVAAADWILPYDDTMPPAGQRWQDDLYPQLDRLIGQTRQASGATGN